MSFLPAIVLAVFAAAPPPVSLSFADRFTVESWTSERDLPQNTITAVCQTGDGYLWFGSRAGLVRFDGIRFSVFDSSNMPGIPSLRVSSMAVWKNDGLVVGTETGGFFVFSGGRVRAHNRESGFPGTSVSQVVAAESGDIWIISEDGAHVFRDGNVFDPNLLPDARRQVRRVFPGRNGRLWIYRPAARAVDLFEDGAVTRTIVIPDPLRAEIACLSERPDGTVLAGTAGQGLFRIAGGRIFQTAAEASFPAASIRFMVETRMGGFWFGTDDLGLVYRDGDEEGEETAPSGVSLFGSRIWSMVVDREDNLWVGTDTGGLNKVKPRLIRALPGSGLPEPLVSVFQDDRGVFWIGRMSGRLAFVENGIETVFTGPRGVPAPANFAIRDRRDRIWAATDREGLLCIEGKTWRLYTPEDGLADPQVNALYEDASGRVWIGTRRGLSRWTPEGLQTWTAAQGFKGDYVTAIAEAPGGGMWIGTNDQGAALFENGEWTWVTKASGLSNENIRAIHVDAGGTAWLGTYGGGLNRVKNGEVEPIRKNRGLFDDIVSAVLDDGLGFCWMACNRGLFRASWRELNDLADGKTERVTCVSFGRAEGMLSIEANGGSQPSSFRTRDGRLVFATMGGAAVVDPAASARNPLPPPVVIERIVADGRSLPRENATPPVLPARTERLEFGYAGLSYTSPEKVLFRIRLEGFDRDWTEAGTRREAFYTNLPPGRFVFRVTACNNDGVWNEEGAAFAFQVARPFTRTLWFVLICAAAAALGVNGIYRVRVGVLLRRRRELEREVSERTRRLTTEIAVRKETEARLQSSLDERRLLLAEIHHRVKNNMQMVLSLLHLQESRLPEASLRGVFRDYRNRVRSMALAHEILYRSPEVSRIDFDAYAQELIGHLRNAHALDPARVEVRLNLDKILLNITTAIPCGLILNELAMNAFKYAFPGDRTGVLSVDLNRVPDGRFELVVRDDGVGLPSGWDPRNSRGLGMQIVMGLLSQIDGEMEILSGPGTGFRIVFREQEPRTAAY
ncbi:MAG: hypothetical protein JW843_08645 [Candidatus Aminicenantes bacterium]|nr:hypothetical protein [Candidatus Aminicenantes bacterium]